MFLVCTFLKGEHSIKLSNLFFRSMAQKHLSKVVNQHTELEHTPFATFTNRLFHGITFIAGQGECLGCVHAHLVEERNMGLVGGSKVCTNNQSLY